MSRLTSLEQPAWPAKINPLAICEKFMFLNPVSLNSLASGVGWFILLLFMSHALLTRPWQNHPDTPLSSIWPAFVVALMTIWLLKAGLQQGLEIHILGLTAFTLMFGSRLAILGVISVYLLLAVADKAAWSSLGWNALLVGVFPILLAAQIHRFVYRKLPHNYFVFVFLSSFLNGVLVMVFTMGLLTGFMLLTSVHPVDLIKNQFLLITPLLIFPEAFFNGGLMAVLVIYRPHWVLGYNQDLYLRN